MPSRIRSVSIALLLLAAPAADALTLIGDDRSVYDSFDLLFDGLPPQESLETPSAPFGPFHADAGAARQDSEISVVASGPPSSRETLLTATANGRGSGSASLDVQHTAESIFSIRFRVDAPTAFFDLSGTLDSDDDWFHAWVEVRSGATLLYRADVEYSVEYEDWIPTPFALTTALAAGDYEIFAIGGSSGGPPGEGTGIFALSFTVREVVPEPGTALLVALGAGVLASRGRRVP